MALLSSSTLAQTIQTLDGRPLTADGIQTQIDVLMSAAHVEGLGVALIRDGQVVYRHSFGIWTRLAIH